MTERRSDAFSRFSWIPAVAIGVIGLALRVDIWWGLGLTLLSFFALLALDRLWSRRGRDRSDE